MTLIKWFPVRDTRQPANRQGSRSPFDVVQHDIDHLFRRFFDDTLLVPALRANGGELGTGQFMPRLDVTSEKEHLRITAELPGMDANDVELHVEDGTLILKGEKKAEQVSEEAGRYHVERSFGAFQRVIPLPDDVDAGQAEAQFDKGVLTVRVPKVAPKEARKIEIK